MVDLEKKKHHEEKNNADKVKEAKRRLNSRIYSYTCQTCGFSKEIKVSDTPEVKKSIMDELVHHDSNIHESQMSHTSRLSEN